MAEASEITIAPGADFHVHLRQGEMTKVVVPTIREGGCSLAYVMPNLVPPITSVAQAVEYKSMLESFEPDVQFMMTLYLCPDITPDVIRMANRAGISGCKSYPKGILKCTTSSVTNELGATTNSESGIEGYEPFYPTFKAMEECDMVLNIHGEVPPSKSSANTVMDAESAFLPTLIDLHRRFPKLRIVLEHCTTKDAIDAVLACGDSVRGTITAHHLFLTINHWCDDPFSFCKPVAKLPSDREALLKAATSGNSKFFLGSDSAPHPVTAKRGGLRTAAGCFTQPIIMPLLAKAFEERGCLDKLEGFSSTFGREFYKVPATNPDKKIKLVRTSDTVKETYGTDDLVVRSFMAGESLGWKVEW